MPKKRPFRLRLMGSFQLISPDGERVRIASKKGMALISLVATARSGERSRVWLQDHLWGSRALAQAQSSLRRELANLRAALRGGKGEGLILADAVRVGIDLDRVDVDVRAFDSGRSPDVIDEGEFLEGFDIAEEGFEDWLREQRSRIESLRRSARPASEPAPAAHPPSPPPVLAGRPTITLLASADTGSKDDGVYVEGVADLLVERIARLRWLAVIASPPGLPAGDLRTVGKRLGADYLLQCRLVAPADNSTRNVHLALSEGATGRVLWSRRYRLARALEEPALSGMAEGTVAALAARIEVEQELRVLDRGIQKLNPNELVWRARWHMRRLTREDGALAARLLEQAAAENGNDPAILIEQAFLAGWRIWASRGGLDEKKAFRLMAVRARHTDPFDARAYHLCGVAEMWLGNHDAAKAMFAEAIELNPSMAYAYGHLGSCHSMAGDPAAAIPLLETALRLDPLNPESFHQFGELALARFMLDRHREAIEDADRSLALRPAYFYAHAIKIAALVECGDGEGEKRARESLAAVKAAIPSDALEWLPFKEQRWVNKLRNALDRPTLRLAG